jgi:hypothetical protein
VTAPITEGCLWGLQGKEATDPEDNIVRDLMVGGIPTVTLANGDTFGSKACGTWSIVDASDLFQNADADVNAAPGVWLVGEDIKPGTYSTKDLGDIEDPAKLCTWTVSEELDNNYTDVITRDVIFSGVGKVVVATGQEFESTHCGSWTLLSK